MNDPFYHIDQEESNASNEDMMGVGLFMLVILAIVISAVIASSSVWTHVLALGAGAYMHKRLSSHLA